eukprot:GAHX01002061.1.p1 GENE.GAHX01002061.1~~GAHX01002061.1.p1  ORF type:complete len:484 (-),score=95.08 GAHX01002061.1:25-1476(-)
MNEINLGLGRIEETKKDSSICVKSFIGSICERTNKTFRHLRKLCNLLKSRRASRKERSYKPSRFFREGPKKLSQQILCAERSPISPWFKNKKGLESLYLKTNVIEAYNRDGFPDVTNKGNIASPKTKSKPLCRKPKPNLSNALKQLKTDDEILVRIQEEVSKLEASEKEILEGERYRNMPTNNSELEDNFNRIRERITEYKNIERDYVYKLNSLEMIKQKTMQIQKANKRQFYLWFKRVCLPMSKEEGVKFVRDSLKSIFEYQAVIKSNQIYLAATERIIFKMINRLSNEKIKLEDKIKEEEDNSDKECEPEKNQSFVETDKIKRQVIEVEESTNRTQSFESRGYHNVYFYNYDKNKDLIVDEHEQHWQHVLDMERRIKTIHKLEKEVTEIKKEIIDYKKQLEKMKKSLYASKYVSNKLKNFDFEEEIEQCGMSALKDLKRKIRIKTDCSKVEEEGSVENSAREIRKLRVETRFILKSLQDVY